MQTIQFNGNPINAYDIKGTLYIKSRDIAEALGYLRTDYVSRIYQRHAAEFDSSMAKKITIDGVSTIAFSHRGINLLALFARTRKGHQFRKWILDGLDDKATAKQQGRSLVDQFFEQQRKMDDAEAVASLCGRGLARFKKDKPRMVTQQDELLRQINPPLFELGDQ